MSTRAYTETSIDWIGTVPEHWELQTVKRFGSVTLGKMLQSESKNDNDIESPYLRAANIQPNGVLALKNVKSMWFTPKESVDLDIRAGDVVVVEGGIGGFGRAAFVSEDLVGVGFQNSINRIRPRNGNDGRYLTYLLLTARKLGFIAAYCNIVSMPHLTAEKLEAMAIPIPPIEEQRGIADYLDTETARIDALITKQERFVDELQERRAAVVTQAITKGLDTTVTTTESGVEWIGLAPGHWTVSKLKFMDPTVNSGTSVNAVDTTPQDGEVGVLKTSAASKGYFDPSESKTVWAAEVDEVSCPVQQGLLLVNRANTPALVGTTAYVDSTTHNLFLSDKLWQVSFARGVERFVWWWSKTSVYRKQVESYCVGASSSMQNLAQDHFRAAYIARPPIDEQQRIVDHLDEQTAKIDTLIAKTEQFIELAQERRAAIITAAATGQIEVRMAAPKDAV